MKFYTPTRNVFLVRPAVLIVLVASVTSPLASSSPALGQANPTHGASHGSTQRPAAAPGKAVAGDYLVSVGKHFMWKSQIETMHPTMAKRATRVSKENKNDFLVYVDKKPVWASTLRRDPNAKTRPAAHNAACRDYLVQIGKQTTWASSADCPMGKHEKGVKPLCCVAPLEAAAGAKLPRCCEDAQKER